MRQRIGPSVTFIYEATGPELPQNKCYRKQEILDSLPVCGELLNFKLTSSKCPN